MTIPYTDFIISRVNYKATFMIGRVNYKSVMKNEDMMIKYRTLDIDGLWNKIGVLDIILKELVQRSAVKKITERFHTDHVEIITGPRQSGKTTLLMLLVHELSLRDIPHPQVYYINLDTILDLERFKDPLLLAHQINRNRRGRERVYFFIDEVQRLENPGRFLKGIYDLGENIKLFATGSSSLELRSKIKEFLTGRKRETRVLPLSFKEYINHDKKIPARLDEVKFAESSSTYWQQNQQSYGPYLTRVMEEMAIYGGYPAVLTANEPRRRGEELEEIYLSYIKKDIVEFLKVGKADVFSRLVKVLASQVGNLVNKSGICSLLGSNAITVTKYMEILEETYITRYLPPFTGTKRSEIKSTPKGFFIDNGLRNYAVRQFNELNHRMDKGALVENLIFTELAKDYQLTKEEFFYWRTKGGAEIDFVLPGKNGVIPVEIKSGSAKAGLLSRSFHSFLEAFSPATAIFLNRDLFHIEKLHKTRVYYIPNHWFLLYGLGIINN